MPRKNMIERVTKAYYERKKWRWKLRLTMDDLFQHSILARIYRLQDITEVSDNEEDTSEDDESEGDADDFEIE